MDKNKLSSNKFVLILLYIITSCLKTILFRSLNNKIINPLADYKGGPTKSRLMIHHLAYPI